MLNPVIMLKKIADRIKYSIPFLYRDQVKVVFPVGILRKYVDYEWKLPPGYAITSPGGDCDLNAWAGLLNADGKFGVWTADRVKSEIIDRLIAPRAASLLFYKNHLIGCSGTQDSSTAKKKIGRGMWLILDRRHRGRKALVEALVFRTLAYFVKGKYKKVVATTDSYRLPALYFYLSNGCRPEYDSLNSIIRWYKIKRRLRAALKRSKNQKHRKYE